MTLPNLPEGYTWEKLTAVRWCVTRKTGEHVLQTFTPSEDDAVACEFFERGYRNGYRRGYSDCKMQYV